MNRIISEQPVTEADINGATDELSPAGSGWWHASTADVVKDALKTLTGHGMTLEDATDLAASLIGAIQNECGD